MDFGGVDVAAEAAAATSYRTYSDVELLQKRRIELLPPARHCSAAGLARMRVESAPVIMYLFVGGSLQQGIGSLLVPVATMARASACLPSMPKIALSCL